ncbi:MAG: hypothetical protein ABIR35_02885 [Polaromonas sp.]
MWKIALRIVAAASLMGCGPQKDIPLAQRYPGEWSTAFNARITKALASNGITGCGEYKHRESSVDRDEFLVYCTRDGLNWRSYLVWSNTGSVTGPHVADSTL